MKKLLAMATLVAVGAGTAGVSALDNVELRGSDTLFGITNDILSNCPDADPDPDGPPVGLTYVGGGSGAGELKLLTTSNFATPGACNVDVNTDGRFECQTVSPMSRFLTNGATCQFPGENVPPGPVPTDNADAAEGIAYSLDGLSIVTSFVYDGTCNEDPGTAGADPDDCNAATDPNAGLAYSKTIAVQDLDGVAGIQCNNGGCAGGNYALAGGVNAWRDVLRIVYTGLPTGEQDVHDRSCGGDLRRTLISNWSNLFQNSCAEDTVTPCCTGALRHAFRRDDESGTTDVFLALIGAPGLSIPNNVSPFCNASMVGDNLLDDTVAGDDVAGDNPWGGTQTLLGVAGQFPGGWPGPYTTGGTWRAGWANSADAVSGVGSPVGTAARAYYPDFQDNDPVRTTCCGTFDFPVDNTSQAEQVCRGLATDPATAPHAGSVGSLGVVMVINPPSNLTQAVAFPSTPCSAGVFRAIGRAPTIGAAIVDPDYPAGFVRTNNTNARCPNGDVPLFLSGGNPAQARCFVPVQGSGTTGTADCLNGRDNLPPLTVDNPTDADPLDAVRVTAFGQPVANFKPGDGRVYNLHLYGPDGAYQVDTRGREIVGAFYRIHTSRTLLTPPTCVGDNCCKFASATQQIGCLAQAGTCGPGSAGSIGYAGLEATDVQLNATGGLQSAISLKVDAKEATAQCVRNLIALPAVPFYPLSRELYLNSMIGFENAGVATQEREMAECFSATAQSSLPGATAAAKLTTLEGLIIGRGFITRGPGNFPVCKDFNQAGCPAGGGHTSPNADACTNNPVGIPNDDPLVP